MSKASAQAQGLEGQGKEARKRENCVMVAQWPSHPSIYSTDLGPNGWLPEQRREACLYKDRRSNRNVGARGWRGLKSQLKG